MLGNMKKKPKKRIKPAIRALLPPNKRHKTKKDYMRKNKVNKKDYDGID